MRCSSRSTRSRESPRRWVSTKGSAAISHASWVSTARAWGHGSSQASQVQAEPSSPPYGSSSTPASSTASTRACGSSPASSAAMRPASAATSSVKAEASESSSTGTVTSTVKAS